MRIPAIVASLIIPASALVADTAQESIKDATEVFQEVMQTPDKGIPQDLLEKAQCVVIVPGLKKGAFIVGGEYGRGVAECRRPDRSRWSAPAMVRVEGGSVGFQIGGTSTDVVMLIMSQRGMDKLMSDKFTLGADASVAAGPVGRTAQAATDVELHAEILAWSRARGVFAGISLSGATLRPDDKRNEDLYGHKISNREVLNDNAPPPPAARPLIAELNKYSPRAGDSADRQRH
ncbi:MAG TPA: lipid-binding SYLF domain-containing protein [Bryobacteraceae bacterium]|jgi:lipid-binding SYLF domain-containing protein|nr:lipid-binding SYLF domain-containing protein [Bryobacteraceae bacterium]